MAKILDGKKASAELLKKITKEVSAWKKRGVTPGIAFILVGHHPASQIYVRNKVAACAKVGIVSQKIELPASISEQKLCETIRKCNKNKNIHGILVQLPLPASIHAQRVLSSIDPKKDVDGFHPGNSGKLVLGIDGLRPCTPLGILYLLESLKMNWQGKNAVVIGRSAVVGKPVALMLLEQDMTVQICHSKTKNLKEKVLQADLLVVADETLLNDPAARALEGVTEATAVFVNTTRSPEEVHAASSVAGRLSTMDLTGVILAKLGRVGALSAPLGAAAARLLGLSEESLRAAVSQELRSLGVTASVLERNLEVATDCFQAVPIVPVGESSPGQAGPASLWSPIYEAPTRGTARIAAGANTPLRKTGDWRTFRPVLIPEKCNGCWLCYVYCPDAAITLTQTDKPVIDYDHCKGCMLCVEECPTHALVSEREAVEGAR